VEGKLQERTQFIFELKKDLELTKTKLQEQHVENGRLLQRIELVNSKCEKKSEVITHLEGELKNLQRQVLIQASEEIVAPQEAIEQVAKKGVIEEINIQLINENQLLQQKIEAQKRQIDDHQVIKEHLLN